MASSALAAEQVAASAHGATLHDTSGQDDTLVEFDFAPAADPR